MKLVVAILLASFPAFVFSALPPGYQDKLLCPCNFCRVPKQQPLGWVGPQASFVQCKNSCGDTKPVTTWGSRVSTTIKLNELQSLGYHEKECSSSSVTTYACKNAAVSCKNGKVASDVPKSCTLWHDGCNKCLANDGVLGGCTKMYCATKGPAYCSHYKDGMECTGAHKCSPPQDCTSFYDGCNSCGAQNGRTTFCTMMYCMPEYQRQPYCRAFADGRKCQGLDQCGEVVVVKG